MPLAVVGICLALRGVLGPDTRHAWTRVRWLGLSGLVLGAALQIKYTVVFDLVAFLVAYFILTAGHNRIREALLDLGAVALGVALPSLAVLCTYVVNDQLPAFLSANVVANSGYGEVPHAHWTRAAAAMMNHGPLWAGAGLALALGPKLAASSAERRALIVAAIWIVAIMIGIAFLRKSYFHYFFQLLPPLCLLTGYVTARSALDPVRPRLLQAAAFALFCAYALSAAGQSVLFTAGHLTKERIQAHDPAWGDTPGLVARDLRSTLQEDDQIYVFDHNPLIYYLLSRQAPTRFVSPDHLFKGAYGLIDPEEEFSAIVDQRPEVIVTRDTTLTASTLDKHGPDARDSLTGDLQALVEREYRLERSYPAVDVGEGDSLGNGAWGAKVYRRTTD